MKPTNEQIESIQYAADWLSRSEDIGNQKHAERLRALLAAAASEGQKPVAQIVRGKTVAGLDVWDIKIFDKTLQNGTKLYKDPSGEIVALRERIADKEADNVRLVHANQDLRDQMRERIAGIEKEAHVLPAELTPPVRRILGMMLWETTPIAGALRAAGRQIPRRVEDEQAAALHWLLGFALEHGMDWHKPAAAALHKMTQGIKD